MDMLVNPLSPGNFEFFFFFLNLGNFEFNCVSEKKMVPVSK